MKITTNWLAGFVEGDGCFAKKAIIVTQKNIEPLEAVHRQYGGSIYGPDRDGKFQWRLGVKQGSFEVFKEVSHGLSSKRLSQATTAGFVVDNPPSVALDLSWAAGFYEAEGGIFLRHNGGSNSGYRYPSVCITQYYSPEPLNRFKEVTGTGLVRGPYSAGAHGKVAYCYRLNGAPSIALATSMFDMLSKQKNEQVSSVIAGSTLGTRAPRKLTNTDVEDIFRMRESGSRYKDIAIRFDVTPGRIGQIVREGKVV